MKHAFTMLELVFVIVLIGIISVLAIPRFDDNNLRQAADQLVGHIRYTQHLAMMDDKFDAGDIDWYKRRWQIVFSSTDNFANNRPSYSIYRNLDADPAVDREEIARNPLNNERYMTGGVTGYVNLDIRDLSKFVGTQEMNLGEEYGVESVNLSSSCSTGTKIGFDYLGRPLRGPLRTSVASYDINKIMTQSCDINITIAPQTITIRIEPETGYTHILN